MGQAAQVYLYDTAAALSGTNPKNLTALAGSTFPATTDDGPDWAPDRFPAYSPDGTKLAFTRQAATTGNDVWTSELASLSSTSTASSGPRDITPARGPDQHPNWLRITSPPVEVPEVPLVPLISLSAALLLGGVMLRRRAHGVA